MKTDALAQGWTDTQRMKERDVDRDEKADATQEAVDGLEYHGVPVLRGVLQGWDGPEGRYWRAGVDAAMSRRVGTAAHAGGGSHDTCRPDQCAHAPKPRHAPGVLHVSPGDPPLTPGVMLTHAVHTLADALDQPTGELPFPGLPEGGPTHG